MDHSRFKQRQREFIKLMNSDHSGDASYRRFEWWTEATFCAFAKAAALAFADQERADALESRYAAVLTRAGKVGGVFPQMLGIMVTAMEESEGRDFLSGVVSDEDVNALSKGAGQFFTPFDVSRMMAEMSLHDLDALMAEKRYVTVGEPCSGAGGMLLAVAQVFRERGYDPMTRCWFEAGDISSMCMQMTYIQATLAGMAGQVVCRNTLTNDAPSESANTIGGMFFVARNGAPRLEPLPLAGVPEVADVPFALTREPERRATVQASLF